MAEEEEEEVMELGAYGAAVRLVEDAASEILLLWALNDPTARRHNFFVRHAALTLPIDSCGRHLSILQSPSSMSTPGVTGAVMWDSGVVLGKFLEHAVDSGKLSLKGKKVVELGSGCGLVGCIAALLGGDVILTDLPDRLKLLRRNVESNLGGGGVRGNADVKELTWGDELDFEFIDPLPDFVLGSDVIYSESAVMDLLSTITQLCGGNTTIFLAGELRNDAVLNYFLEAAVEEFTIGCVDQTQWHPDYRSHRVALFILVKKITKFAPQDPGNISDRKESEEIN
ncbi:Lysine methyltransferase protein [Dioscorea alata]|uniref:Lysine methyltransferase protein n=1 Tax=Dioscorea alata TaxID=55571 RepID=A0ACB7V6L6_DIOAL|nr:Lysine methyltransferase protein [Dioscorea alata]